ncbi:helix-turn-helix domain-containing protein [Monoglobus pectinilyticus]|uniref:helix-turn-helix domain-containing protein n=1 Tax=Monoglobus pectinilyticus TaxID=1981510 RepID=UPI00399BDBDD
MIRILLSRKLGELRWTQADLARKTGIRPNTINDLYHEMTDRVSLEQIDLICEALNCDLIELLVGVPNSVSELNSRNRLGELKKDT